MKLRHPSAEGVVTTNERLLSCLETRGKLISIKPAIFFNLPLVIRELKQVFSAFREPPAPSIVEVMYRVPTQMVWMDGDICVVGVV